MLRLKLLLLIGLSAAGQGFVRLPPPRLDEKARAADGQNARGRQLQRLQAELDRFNAEQRASQLRLKRLHAAREERRRATRLTDATPNEHLQEQDRLEAEVKQLREQLKRLREPRQPGGPGESEPQLRPRFDLQPIERKPFDSPPRKLKDPPPQIDDMPPLGPVAFARETPMISARA